MKNYIVTVGIDLGDSSKKHALERVKRIPFGNNNCGFRIVGIKKGTIPDKDNLAMIEEIRESQNEG